MFLFCLDLELSIKMVFVIVQKPGLFLEVVSRKSVQNLNKNFMVVGARQSFQFLGQNTWS